jgi:hypothetical protein
VLRFWVHVSVDCPNYKRFKVKTMKVILSEEFEGCIDENENLLAFTVSIRSGNESSVSNRSESSHDDSNEENNTQTASNKLFKECIKLENISILSLKKLNEVELERDIKS